jgi:8-oxo-dGTP pyrophosphatase MutT (NUDIX family)
MKLILHIRQKLTRLWLRTFGPRWTVGCLVVLRDSRGRVCFLKHQGRSKPWGLPGGLIKWPENPQEALRRELTEELKWCTAGQLILRQTLISEKFPMIELIFEAKSRVSDEEYLGWVIQEAEIDEYLWMSADELGNHEGILARHKSAVLNILHSE